MRVGSIIVRACRTRHSDVQAGVMVNFWAARYRTLRYRLKLERIC